MTRTPLGTFPLPIKAINGNVAVDLSATVEVQVDVAVDVPRAKREKKNRDQMPVSLENHFYEVGKTQTIYPLYSRGRVVALTVMKLDIFLLL